ncbi:MAG: adenosylcobalamin-dependent ribonucleoside-diphosphate reductase, partial [Oscillospiraceae bacterium]|nr:adenosylcobalamin-dependent ribonucleoside-diphosphate reductase [Oscillospiraceae bacterium]
TGGAASGPVSFMRGFNPATEAVKQGGTRRGANMGVLRADHPDILDFIRCKSDTAQLANFNISVGLTEAFMEAAAAGREYTLIDPRGGGRYPAGTLNASEVLDAIVEAAWSTGEPGILFLDRINRASPVPALGEIESTNPCGEQPLLPYESCNLGSINLKNMARADGSDLDWGKLESVTRLSVRFLDNVIDVNRYPLEVIAEATRQTRKIGLGVMGFADLLLLLGVPYDSAEGVALGGRVMAFIDRAAKEESALLASERGPFPAFEASALKIPRRNATLTTIAPTGTISMIAGVSSGIEPVFAYAFTRHIMDGARMTEWNPILRGVLERHGVSALEELPEAVRRVFVSAHEVIPEWHIRMQAAFQEHVDNAVSKTVNFPAGAAPEQVREVFELAWRLGCKGVTIYRDGSRQGQVLVKESREEPPPPEISAQQPVTPRRRARVTHGQTERVEVGCGHLYITVNSDEDGICEIFTNTGKKGGCPSQSEATARLASAALRAGMDPAYIVRQLRGIRCPATIRHNARNGGTGAEAQCTSCPDAIARVLERLTGLGGAEPRAQSGPACPECEEPLTHESGCVICRNCGYSQCG